MIRHLVVLGSGAREHAVAAMLQRSNAKFGFSRGFTCAIHCMGTSHNPGIASICRDSGGSYGIGTITDANRVVDFCKRVEAELMVIGPEAPLETGVADRVRETGVAVVGPGREQARIETSKSFARELLQRILPQACPRYLIVEHPDRARACIEEFAGRYVVKADGLAGGKGVMVSGEHLHSTEEALAYCERLLCTAGRIPEENAAPERCVIEEKLEGEEFSLMTVTDGAACIHFPAVQDHKRAYDGDRGSNTGGMGSYSSRDHSLPFLTRVEIETARAYNEAVIAELWRTTGGSYRGILYGGFMATATGVKIIEYNARFGDPEALNLMALLLSDGIELFERTANGNLSGYRAEFAPKASVCVYAVPEGYPDTAAKGMPITVSELDPDVSLFFGSVDERPDGSLITGGSRTAAVVALGETIEEARSRVMENIGRIGGPLRYRTDIGSGQLLAGRLDHMRTVRRELSIAVLGSTRGTDLDAVTEAIGNGCLHARIALVVSDRSDAGILKKAEAKGIPTLVAPLKGRKRETQEENITRACVEKEVDLIVLIGYMRILSNRFCRRWKNRVMNIHPSLLPDFAGLMDGDVHAEAIERMRLTGKDITGCTVHVVTSAVDSGAILLQKKCRIENADTPETLKRKVQNLEGEALCACIARAQMVGGDLGNWEACC